MNHKVCYTKTSVLFAFWFSMLCINGQEPASDPIMRIDIQPQSETVHRQHSFIADSPSINKPSVTGLSLSLPSAQDEGITLVSGTEKPGKSNTEILSLRGIEALTATVYDAWWSNEYDAEGDGYVQSATLNWDADVAGGTGSLSVFAKLYYKPSASSVWTLVTTTASYTITDNNVNDVYFVNLHNVSHGIYDWRIDIYRSGQASYDASYGPYDDPHLNDYAMETAAEDVEPRVLIDDAWWIDQVDQDGDGYSRIATLRWDSDVAEESISKSVFEKIYWRFSSEDSWRHITTTPLHVITGTNNADIFQFKFTVSAHDLYDLRIDVFREGQIVPDQSYGPANDPDLSSVPFENAFGDVEPMPLVKRTWWSDIVDNDGDGYPQSSRLHWSPYVSDGYTELMVYEKVYWKLSTSSTWNLLITTSNHNIKGFDYYDYSIELDRAFDHNLYDWKIEIYRAGRTSPDHSWDQSDDPNLNAVPLEKSEQDVEPMGQIYDVSWNDPQDIDQDGYFRSSELIWYISVTDGYSSPHFDLNISYKPSASNNWQLLQRFLDYPGSGGFSNVISELPHGTYDFKIEVFKHGQSTPDDTYVDHAVINAYPMETAAEDVVGDAVISGPDNICPGASASFSATALHATSYQWEVPTGWSINSGQGSASVSITAGSNSGNVCVTPSAAGGSGSIRCKAVIVIASPGLVTLTGSPSICAGATGSYSASASNADFYTWNVPSGWTINSGQGSSAISVTAGANPGNICVTPSNSCGEANAGCLAINLNSVPEKANVGGGVSVCEGNKVDYTALAAGADTYTWSVPAGWTIDSGQGSSTITVTVGSSSGNICVTPSNTCGNGLEGCMEATVYGTPGEVTITGDENVISGTLRIYSAVADQANYFTWSVPAGWTINSGQGTDSLVVTTGSASGYVCVTPMNDCVSGLPNCTMITTSDLPGAVTLHGNSQLCEEKDGLFYADAEHTETYIWTASEGWTIKSGQGTYSVIISAGESTGTICVTPANSSGEGIQECMEVTLHSLPAKPSEILGEKEPLVNESYTYSVDLVDDATVYLWNSSDGERTPDHNELVITWQTPGKQYLTVMTGNECGQSDAASLEIMVQQPTSMRERLQNSELVIHPNPTSGLLTVEMRDESVEVLNVTLYDITATPVFLDKKERLDQSNSYIMDISHLKSGIYVLCIQTREFIITRKIVKE
jgi:hypothetical protein